jgi:4-hydroxy-3-methylbut-2-enyl diphosphate reductase
VAQNMGVPAYMVDHADQVQREWVADKRRIGVTAGASAPEMLVLRVIERLKELGVQNVSQLEGVEENVAFPLPRGLSLSS